MADESTLRSLVAKYHKEQLIIPMEIMDGANLSDLQRLSVLQHLGAGTGLLDFTESPLVALWFACTELPDKDAQVFALDIGDPQVARNGRRLDDPFDLGQAVVYYEPDRSLGARIVAQQSVFVICKPQIPNQYVKSVVVPKESKEPLRAYLTQLGLSQTALFGDIPGLAAANATRVGLHRMDLLTPEQHRDLGNRAYQLGRYDDALAAYEAYEAMRPDTAQPYCLKGDTLAALGRFNEADQAYTRAIANLDQPAFLDKNLRVNPEPIRNMMSPALYYNRGNVRAAAGDHHGAVADFDIAFQHDGGPKRDILKNRGNSKFALETFAEAHRDFEAAGVEREGSDLSLAMGNCKVMTGEFEEALQRYLDGSGLEPEETAASCTRSAERVRRILETLRGHDFQVIREAGVVFVETKCARGGPIDFSLVGNQGNTGNIPSGFGTARGGDGYSGTKGIVVRFALPTSRPKEA